jgi:hypothetical protein
MSGAFTRRWSDEQKRAIERRVIDDGVKVPQVAREAQAGELRAELEGPKLEPFAMPIGTIRRVVDDERKRRRKQAISAAAITDPDAYTREMLRKLLAEANEELRRMHTSLHHGPKRKTAPAWAEITEAAKALETLARANAALNRQAKPSTPVQTPVKEAKPSLVSSLAKQRPSKTEAKTQGQEPTTRLPAHVQQEPNADEAGGAVPSYAREDSAA